MEVTIYGAGSIGLTLAGLLSYNGVKTNLLMRENKHKIIANDCNLLTKNKSIMIKSNDLNFMKSAKEIKNENTISFIATKTYDIADCISSNPGILESKAIVLVQNGLFPEREILKFSDRIDRDVRSKIYGMIIFGSSEFYSYRPPKIKYDFNKIILGSKTAKNIEILNPLKVLDNVTLLDDSKEYMKSRFLKLLYNAIDPLAFLINSSVGETIRNDILRSIHMKKQMEILKLAKHSGLGKIDFDFENFYMICMNRFSNHIPSMVGDLRKQITDYTEKPFNTEVMHTDISIANESRRFFRAVENESIGNKILDFTKRFNSIKAKDYSAAREFALLWIRKNRKLYRFS